MGCYYKHYHSDSAFLWISPLVNSSDFALRATTSPLGALTLKPSGLCNIGGYFNEEKEKAVLRKTFKA
jgi:hypothetical protein